jgi:hypothetical protein
MTRNACARVRQFRGAPFWRGLWRQSHFPSCCWPWVQDSDLRPYRHGRIAGPPPQPLRSRGRSGSSLRSGYHPRWEAISRDDCGIVGWLPTNMKCFSGIRPTDWSLGLSPRSRSCCWRAHHSVHWGAAPQELEPLQLEPLRQDLARGDLPRGAEWRRRAEWNQRRCR